MPERIPCVNCGRLITKRGWRRHHNSKHRAEMLEKLKKEKKLRD